MKFYLSLHAIFGCLLLASTLPSHPVVLGQDSGNETKQVYLHCDELNESSGLAVVVADSAHEIWSHNDSGDQPRCFAFSSEGKLLRTIAIDGAKAIDWEDMCSFVQDGKQYVALGDVGDNNAKRQQVTIYVCELKRGFSTQDRLQLTTILNVLYPDGAVNCEALAYDPLKRSLVLASKELLRCRLFEVDANSLHGESQRTAKLMGTIALPLVTGCDISRDGTKLVLATYGPGRLVLRDGKGEWITSDPEATHIFQLPARRQGESICFDPAGKQLLLTSEFTPSPLLEMPVPTREPEK